VFIERKPTALRAANLLKHEATEYKNHQNSTITAISAHSAMITLFGVCVLYAVAVVVRRSRPEQGSALVRPR
jgi:nitric oxide reductase large subunit